LQLITSIFKKSDEDEVIQPLVFFGSLAIDVMSFGNQLKEKKIPQKRVLVTSSNLSLPCL
jgi:hypothetical protein